MLVRPPTLAGGADSFYEYLLKLWLLGGRAEGAYWSAYLAAVRGIDEGLVRRGSSRDALVFVGELSGSSEVDEHLASSPARSPCDRRPPCVTSAAIYAL